jgi:hypothetical protein
MKIVHSVQVHPIYSGHINDHKVITEVEFSTAEEALQYVKTYNNPAPKSTIAVYAGMIDDETGENL